MNKNKGFDSGKKWQKELLHKTLREFTKVTICIAAICNHQSSDGYKIVLCCDAKASSDLGSAETSRKRFDLDRGWQLMGAGDKSEILSFLPLLKAKLRSADTIDETNIKRLIREAIEERKHERAALHMAVTCGLNYDDLSKRDRENLIDPIAKEMEIASSLMLDAEFIVAGFCTDGQPILCEVDPNIRNEDQILLKEHCAAIGQGGYLAMASLIQREYSYVLDLHPALFYIYEAKRHSEKVNSVGTGYTRLEVHSPKQKYRVVTDDGIELLKNKFDEFSVPRYQNFTLGDNCFENG